jgi:aryl-alcohol dehydrogenase-like predicted oxidoreductase
MSQSPHPEMLYRTLGRTGETVSAIGLGGFHLGLGQVDEQLAIRIVRTAHVARIDLGQYRLSAAEP